MRTDQCSEGARRSAERHQLSLAESGLAAPALQLRTRVNARPRAPHGEVKRIDRARPVTDGIALGQRIDQDQLAAGNKRRRHPANERLRGLRWLQMQDVGEQYSVEGFGKELGGVVVGRDELDPFSQPEALRTLFEGRQDRRKIAVSRQGQRNPRRRQASRQGDGSPPDPRANQRRRTKAAIMEGARRLLLRGRVPSIADAAEEAGGSRATAYRYFPTQGALIREAVDSALVRAWEWEERLEGAGGLRERVERHASELFETVRDNEALMRGALLLSLEQWAKTQAGEELGEEPIERGGRRDGIRVALDPYADTLPADVLRRLAIALSIVGGIEAGSSYGTSGGSMTTRPGSSRCGWHALLRRRRPRMLSAHVAAKAAASRSPLMPLQRLLLRDKEHYAGLPLH